MSKILFVEDDENQVAVMRSCMAACGHALDVANDARTAIDFIAVNQYDLFILDWNLPDGTGLQLLQQIRRGGKHVPVLMLTGNSSIQHKEEGFGSGADDYLVKPFDLRELKLRIEALLRRPSTYTGVVLRAGELELDTQTYQVRKNGKILKLQPKEFTLLTFFMRNQRVVFSAEAILDRVWSMDDAQGPESVRKVIQRLRQKIDDEGCESMIKTSHTRGYSFDP
ncbi:MAG: response regulator transcription factor [Cyanobacteria bacterium]|nr:response regulator transcription factor [Cyanobacteriota bacterium]